MNKILSIVALAFFVAFLASPTLIDSVHGDGTIKYMPGYACLFWALVMVPEFPLTESLILFSFFVTGLGLTVIWPISRSGILRSFFVCGLLSTLFLSGIFSAIWIALRSGFNFGIYFWSIASFLALCVSVMPLLKKKTEQGAAANP
jgi:hypothetical protein